MSYKDILGRAGPSFAHFELFLLGGWGYQGLTDTIAHRILGGTTNVPGGGGGLGTIGEFCGAFFLNVA